MSSNGIWVENQWKWTLHWRRNLFHREESVVTNLINMLETHKMNRGMDDRWVWKGVVDGRFLTKAAYTFIFGKRYAVTSQLTRIWSLVFI